jgi:hypothetical protein
MMKLLLTLMYVAALARTAQATTSATPWIAVGGGLSSYVMYDVNWEIGKLNTALAGSGRSLNKIDRGASGLVLIGVDFGNGVSLGAAYDRLLASSAIVDRGGSLEYDLPSNLYRVVCRVMRDPTRRSGMFAEVSAGRISSAGNVRFAVASVGSRSGAIQGTGMAYEGALGACGWGSPMVGLSGSLGYRHATVTDVRSGGIRVIRENGNAYSLDYSGIVLRAALEFGWR